MYFSQNIWKETILILLANNQPSVAIAEKAASTPSPVLAAAACGGRGSRMCLHGDLTHGNGRREQGGRLRGEGRRREKGKARGEVKQWESRSTVIVA